MSRRGTDVRMQYRNVSYEFVHGSHTNTIPFDVIIDLVEDGLQIVQEIIEHPKIRNYAGEILDPVLKSE